jgi:glycosyltransferase 2 family protein
MSRAPIVEERVEGQADGRVPPDEPVAAAAVVEGEEAGVGPGSLRSRVLRPETLVSFAIALAVLVFFFRRLDIDPGEVWRHARNANPLYLALAFVSWYGTFGFRAYRWKHMLERVGVDRAHGYAVPSTRGFVEIFLLAWFANCVVPAKLGDAYRSYLLKRESGASFSTALGTILAERLTDLTVLFLTMSAVGVVVFGGRVPDQAAQTFLLGLGLLVVAVVGLGVMWFFRHRLERRLPARVRDQYGRLHDAVFACLRRPGMFLAISVVVWLGEGLRVFFVAEAVDADVAFTTAMFVALMASLLTTLPLTPAGLGVVEGAIITVLVKVMDMENSLAASIAVLDRVIGYWLVIAIGLVLYGRRARRGLA